MEIENPGGLPAGLARQDFGKTSLRRNLTIADLFHRMGKVERIGSGIRRMRDLVRAAGLKAPQFESTNFFRTSFPRDPRYSLKRLKEEPSNQKGLVEGLVENQKKIIDLVKDNPPISKKE